MDIISMINYAAMNKDYTWINQIKQDIIDKTVLKNSRQEVIDVILQYIDDIIPQDQQGDQAKQHDQLTKYMRAK